MKSRSTYGQHGDGCAAAHALDIVGDRWALLIVRELMLGVRRFSDIRRGLPGISAAMLTTRLAEMVESGVCEKVELPPPASTSGYRLTPWGLELEPILEQLGRWGQGSTRWPQDSPVSDATAVLALRTMRSQTSASSLLAVDIDLETEHVRIEIDDRMTVARRSDDAPASSARLTTDARTLVDLALEGVPLTTAEADGRAAVDGDRLQVERLLSLLGEA